MKIVKIIVFLLIILLCINGLRSPLDYTNSFNLFSLLGFLIFLFKTEEQSKLQKCYNEINAIKSQLEVINNKISTIATRNQLQNKNIMGK